LTKKANLLNTLQAKRSTAGNGHFVHVTLVNSLANQYQQTAHSTLATNCFRDEWMANDCRFFKN
jgi:hypothetical protein